jgi:hypothetical protein
MSRITLRRPSLALAGILIAIGGCAESPSSPSGAEFLARGPHPRYEQSGSRSAVIDERGGTLVTSAGDRITFPAGALSGNTRITITSNDDFVGVELKPHGLHFPQGRQPVLELNAGGAAAESGRSIDVAYVDESGNVAEVLDASASGGELRTNLQHFSGYLAISH